MITEPLGGPRRGVYYVHQRMTVCLSLRERLYRVIQIKTPQQENHDIWVV